MSKWGDGDPFITTPEPEAGLCVQCGEPLEYDVCPDCGDPPYNPGEPRPEGESEGVDDLIHPTEVAMHLLERYPHAQDGAEDQLETEAARVIRNLVRRLRSEREAVSQMVYDGHCTTCGTPAEIVTSDEGTCYVRPTEGQAVGWELWETCPKDGRTVLARFADDYIETVARNPDGSWYWTHDGDTAGTLAPTHWIPLPGPPVPTEGQEGDDG